MAIKETSGGWGRRGGVSRITTAIREAVQVTHDKKALAPKHQAPLLLLTAYTETLASTAPAPKILQFEPKKAVTTPEQTDSNLPPPELIQLIDHQGDIGWLQEFVKKDRFGQTWVATLSPQTVNSPKDEMRISEYVITKKK